MGGPRDVALADGAPTPGDGVFVLPEKQMGHGQPSLIRPELVIARCEPKRGVQMRDCLRGPAVMGKGRGNHMICPRQIRI